MKDQSNWMSGVAAQGGPRPEPEAEKAQAESSTTANTTDTPRDGDDSMIFGQGCGPDCPDCGGDPDKAFGGFFEAIKAGMERAKREGNVRERKRLIDTLARSIENLSFAAATTARLIDDAFPHPDDEA